MISEANKILIGESDWPDFSRRLAVQLVPGDVILLSGEMGAGKTTFVFHVLQALASPDLSRFSSPTFSIFQAYATSRFPIHHFDLYRLNTAEDWDALDLTDEMVRLDAVSFIEWGDRFALPGVSFTKTLRLQIPDDGNGRLVSCEGFHP